MRKDEIEERIIQIEKQIRDLGSIQREQGELIISELRSFQNLFIEEKIEVMRKQITQGYQRLLLDLVLNTMRREFESVCPNPCSLYNRTDCIDFFMCRLKESAERMDPDEADDFLKNQIQIDDELMNKYPELRQKPCISCFKVYTTERDQLMKAIGELSLTRSGLKRQGQISYMKDLPDEMVLSRIIEPLSHPVRFSMIKALSRGGMSYKELSTLTGYKGGHLLFHVTRLIEAELVVKDATSGQYLITEKGFGLMEMIKKMYSGL